MDYSSPRAKRLGVHWLEAMLLETPSHPTGPTTSLALLRSRWTSVDYSSPRAKRLGVHWLEAMLLETPVHPTGPTTFIKLIYKCKKHRTRLTGASNQGATCQAASFRRKRIPNPTSAKTPLKKPWHGLLRALVQEWADMNCTINSASNFSGLQAGMSPISPAQLTATVRKSTLDTTFILPILLFLYFS